MSRRLNGLAAMAALVLAIAPASAQDAKPAGPALDALPAATAPPTALWAASFKDLADQPQPLSAYKGKIALVYFWATWCEPCQKEGPAFQALYEKFKDKNFVVVGIAVDNADKVRAFVKDKGMAFPNVYGGTDAIKLSKELGNTLGGIPYVLIVDKDGRVVERITGEAKDGRIDGIVASLVTK